MSAHVRNGEQTVLDQRKRAFKTWTNLESGRSDGNTMRTRCQQVTFGLLNNNRLDHTPDFCDFASYHDNLRIEPVDQASDSDTKVTSCFTDCLSRRWVSSIH